MRYLQLLKSLYQYVAIGCTFVWEYLVCSWRTTRGKITIVSSGFFLFLLLSIYVSFIQAPKNFPEHSLFPVLEGATLDQVSQRLYNQGYILSPFWFKTITYLFHGGESIKAGDYFFVGPRSALTIARRLSSGDLGLEPERVTIPEGLNVFQIAELISKQFTQFDAQGFVREAPEGYLFPDTYFFLPNIKSRDVVVAMKQNFDRQIVNVKEDLESFGKPLEDVVKMASILEKEARSFEVRQTIAGILWKRLKIGMPLQVDASFGYVNGKNSFTLTSEDLTIDSPYNSYVYKGLPPTPIANPGLEAIQAALTPIETKYLYFLTDKNGVMRYASDYEGHLKNRRLYLGK